MADFFSLPIGGYGAKPNPWLKSESGRPMYETPLGVSFEIQPQPTQQDVYARSLADALAQGLQGNPFYGPAQAEMDVQRQGAEATLGGILPGLLQGVMQGVEAPGRAARGEPVTYGDAWATALDYGALGAPMKAPDNALRAYALRGGGTTDPTKTGWTFKDVDAGLNRAATAADNRRIAGDTARTETVPIRSLYAMQDTVNPDFAVTSSSAGELPLVVRKNGKMYVRDGHHRITKAAEEGAQSVKTRFIDLDNNDTSTPLLDWQPARWTDEDQALYEALGITASKYGIAGAAAMLGMSAAELQAQMGGASAAPSADDIRGYLNQ